MALKMNFEGSCFCVITGASQGIGRHLSIEFAQQMGPGSILVLMARNKEGLEETKRLATSSNVHIITKPIDLSMIETQQIEDILKDTLQNQDLSKFDCYMIIHNAASVGDVSLTAAELDDVPKWQDYFNLNVFYVSLLNCVFLKVFEKFEDRTVVVNITSLCGIQAFSGLSLYCCGKAAREMYFKVLAVEKPNIKVLNYSPGPVQTAMVESIIQNAANASLRDMFITSQKEKKLLEPEQTAKKCLNVLREGKYKSGDHVDYFD